MVLDGGWLTVAGLIWDIVGVAILAAALIGVDDEEIEKSKTLMVGELVAFSKRMQRFDAIYGAGILCAGFLFQIVGALNIEAPQAVLWVLVLLLFLVLGLFFVDRKRTKLRHQPPTQ